VQQIERSAGSRPRRQELNFDHEDDGVLAGAGLLKRRRWPKNDETFTAADSALGVGGVPYAAITGHFSGLQPC
jgi:hypothetical protein